MKNKLIAFSGAGGTGKTTVAQLFNAQVPSYCAYLAEIFRRNKSFDNFRTKGKPEEILEYQNGILYAQFALEKFIDDSNKNEIIPIERSSIDYAAYMALLTEKYQNDSEIKKAVKKYILNCIDHANKNYAGIVYFPTDIFTPDDMNLEVKERNKESRKKTDNCISLLLKRVKIPILKLEEKNVVDRLNAIKKWSDKL